MTWEEKRCPDCGKHMNRNPRNPNNDNLVNFRPYWICSDWECDERVWLQSSAPSMIEEEG